jgi:hypothetical protein
MRKTIQKAKAVVDTRRDATAAAAPAKAGISLTARQAVAAITFHLLDEGLAERVCPESARRTERRIEAGDATPIEVSRSLWSEMRNDERLAWLLAMSGTDYHVGGDGVARLRGRAE